MKKHIYSVFISSILLFFSERAMANQELSQFVEPEKERILGTNLYVETFTSETGIINDQGKILLKGKYKNIASLDFEVYITDSLERTTSKIIKNKFFIISEKNGKEKVINDQAKIIIESNFDSIEKIFFTDNKYFIVFKKNNKMGLCDHNGKVLLKPEYDHIQSIRNQINFYPELIFFENNGKKGMISSDGKVFLPPIYDDIKGFSNKNASSLFITLNGIDGLIGRDGKIILEPTFESFIPIEHFFTTHEKDKKLSIALVKLKNKWGMINDKGKFIIEPKYELLNSIWGYDLIQYTVNKKIGFITFNGKEVTKPIFDKFGYPFPFDTINGCKYESTLDKEFIPVSINKKWGFIDKSGKLVIEPKFDYIYNSYDGLNYVSIRDKSAKDKKGFERETFGVYDGEFHEDESAYDKWGVVDKSGKWVIKPEFNFVKEFSEGLAFAIKDGKGGFIDTSGKFIIPPQYDPSTGVSTRNCLNFFIDDYAKVIKDKSYQLIDKSGKVKFNYGYDWSMTYATDFYPKRISKQKLEKVDFSDISKVHFSTVSSFNENGVSIVNYGQWYGLVNNEGKFVLKPEYEQITPDWDNGNYFRLKLNNKEGIIDKTGKFVLKPEYDQISALNKDYIFIRRNEKYSFIDNKFNTVTSTLFEKLENFSNGLAVASIEHNNFGFIDKTGKFIIEPKFQSAKSFSENSAWVLQDGKWRLIDKQGKFIINSNFLEISDFENNLSIFKTSPQYILSNETGKLIFPKNFSDISKIYDNRIDYLIDNDKFKENIPKIVIKLKDNNTYQLINEKGNYLNNNKYQEIKDSFVKINNKWGIVDKNFDYIIEPKFEDVDFFKDFNDSNISVKYNGKWGLIDKNGNFVILPKYDELNFFLNELLKAKINGKWGLIDKNEKIIIKPLFDEINYFKDGIAKVKVNGKWGYINEKGDYVIEPKYDEIYNSKNSNDSFTISDNKVIDSYESPFFVVKLDGKIGYITNKGDVLIKPQIDFENEFFNYLKIVSIEDKMGIINDKLEFVLEAKYDSIYFSNVGFYSRSKDDLAKIVLNGKTGFVNMEGKIILDPKYDSIGLFKDGIAIIKQDDLYGFIDKTGKVIANPKYNDVNEFSNDLAIVVINKKFGFIDTLGKEIITPKFDYIGNFEDGIAISKLEGKYGIIDRSGKALSDFKYDEIYLTSFNREYIPFKVDRKWGFFDKFGKIIIKQQFDEVESFSDGLCAVRVGNFWGFINKDGKLIIKPEYYEVSFFYEGLCPVKKGNKWGYIDKSGKLIINFIYDLAYRFENGKAEVFLGDRQMRIDKTGKEVKYPF